MQVVVRDDPGTWRTPISMRCRMVTIAVAAVVAAVAVSVVTVSARDSASPAQADVRDLPNGPIVDRPEHGYVVDESVRGCVFTDGLEDLRLEGSASATIDSIEADGRGFEVIGALVAGPGILEIRQKFDQFPPDSTFPGGVQPAMGAVLRPSGDSSGSMDYELLIGVRVTTDSLGVRKGVWLKYHIGDHYYAEHRVAQIVFCPPSRDWRSCVDEAGVSLG
jgi:hypothetical protein